MQRAWLVPAENDQMTLQAIGTTTRPAALLLGHPGHELRVYGWSRILHPTVCVLTDGSGSASASRLEKTTRILSTLGARMGPVYGRFTDRDFYKRIQERDLAQFTTLADEIAQDWIDAGIESVASDAWEGYCPTHDLCCEIARAAAAIVEHSTGRPIRRYTFRLTELQFEPDEAQGEGVVHIPLDDSLLQEKIAAAKSYDELRREVDQALAWKGEEYFRSEWLIPARDAPPPGPGYKPLYEEIGERRVAEGKYAAVLRFAEHVLPIVAALRAHAARRSAAAPAPAAIA